MLIAVVIFMTMETIHSLFLIFENFVRTDSIYYIGVLI